MKLLSPIAAYLLTSTVVSSFTILSSKHSISRRESEAASEPRSTPLTENLDEALLSYLEKRRGGGSGGGRGGSSGSSSSGSSGSSSGSSGSSGGSSGSSGSRSGSGGVGTSSSSSSQRPSYGGGRYYGGGAVQPYRSGSRTPRGIAPYALTGLALGIFPGIWLYGAYAYNFNHPYYYHNRTNTTDPNNNQSLPVTCLCDKYSACGCDDDGNTTYLDDVLGNGSAADQNPQLVHVGNVNGTKTVVLNGTLPNGTDDSTETGTSGAMRQSILEASGFWVVGAVVLAIVLI